MSDFIPKERFSANIKRSEKTGKILWQESESPYGMNLGICLSAIIKLMRISNWRNACWFSHQMYISGEESEKFLWLHLKTFCVEDISLSDPQCICILNDLEKFYFECDKFSERRFLVGYSAVKYLSSLPKSRENDEAYAAMIIKLRENDPADIPTIPDSAYDYHLKVGRDMGYGLLHYYQHASKLDPDLRISDQKLDMLYLIDRAKKFES